MKNFLWRIAAIALAIFLGGTLNMFIISISGAVIPPPPGADFTTAEGLQQSAHLMEPRHFVMPFLAHALAPCLPAFWQRRSRASENCLPPSFPDSYFWLVASWPCR